MLRVAVPNKGGLAEPSAVMLREAGYRQRSESRELVLTDPTSEIEFYYLRPRDIAVHVGEGMLDVGVTGRDMLLDSGVSAEEVLPLGYASSALRLAAKPGTADDIKRVDGLRIATSYPRIVENFLAENGIRAQVIKLEGAVEIAIRLGVADVIADVVETGATLRQAGLEVFGDPIVRSEAVLIKRSGAEEPVGLEPMLRRLRGVLVARTYVMMDYDIRAEEIDRAVEIAPGFEGPTVSPLHREGWVAVRVMVPRADAQRLMDELWEIGARAILVTDILACRL